MNVTNCRSCGRLFNVLSNERICPECRKKLEDKFQAVKKYLEENPHSSMETVSREMEVSVKQIKQWVREERLILSDASEAGITCECCGRMIAQASIVMSVRIRWQCGSVAQCHHSLMRRRLRERNGIARE